MIADFIINDGLTRQHIAFIGINDFNAHPSFFLLFSTLMSLASDSSLDIRVYSLAPLTPCELREKLTSILGRNIFFDLSEHETPEQQVAEILRSGPHVVVNVAGHTEGGLYAIMNIISQILHLVLVVFLGCPFDYGELPNQTCVVTLTDPCVSKDAASNFFPDDHKFLPCYQVNSHKDVYGDVNELRKGISLKDFGIEEGVPIIACIVRQSRCNFETMCTYMELLKMLPTAIFLFFEQTSSLLQRSEVWGIADKTGVERERIKFQGRLPLHEYGCLISVLAANSAVTVFVSSGENCHPAHTMNVDVVYVGGLLCTWQKAGEKHFHMLVPESILKSANIRDMCLVSSKSEFFKRVTRMISDPAFREQYSSRLEGSRQLMFDPERMKEEVRSALNELVKGSLTGVGKHVVRKQEAPVGARVLFIVFKNDGKECMDGTIKSICKGGKVTITCGGKHEAFTMDSPRWTTLSMTNAEYSASQVLSLLMSFPSPRGYNFDLKAKRLHAKAAFEAFVQCAASYRKNEREGRLHDDQTSHMKRFAIFLTESIDYLNVMSLFSSSEDWKTRVTAFKEIFGKFTKVDECTRSRDQPVDSPVALVPESSELESALPGILGVLATMGFSAFFRTDQNQGNAVFEGIFRRMHVVVTIWDTCES